MIKESIIEIVESGGTISVPHKSEINEYFGELKIFKYEGEYIIYPRRDIFSNIEEAVSFFLNEGYTSKNVGYIQNRLKRKGIIFSDSDIEYPTSKVLSAFEEEGKLVDEESSSLNINMSKPPSSEEAILSIDKMIDDLNIENLANTLSDFRKKYIRLDPYIGLSYKFNRDDGGDYEISHDYKSFNRSNYDKMVNNPYEGLSYRCSSLVIKIGDNFSRYELNF